MNNMVSVNGAEKNELSFEQLEKVSGGFSLFGDEHEDGAKAGTGFVESIWNAGCDLIHLAGCDLIHLASGIAN